jgi:hypothetical protein
MRKAGAPTIPCLQIKGPGEGAHAPRCPQRRGGGPPAGRRRASGRNEGDRLRNTCLMELLYATGLRVSELVSLPVAARGAIRACCWCAARAARNAWCRFRRPRAPRRGMARPSRPGRGPCPGAAPALAASVSLAGQGRAPDPGAVLHADQGDRRQRRDRRPPASRRTSCATPSPRICCRTAPICARSRRFWAMPISPRPRSTPMSSMHGCATWCWKTIRWPRRPLNPPAPLAAGPRIPITQPMDQVATDTAALGAGLSDPTTWITAA